MYDNLLKEWAQDVEAVRKWQAENAGKPFSLPDLGYLLDWREARHGL